MPSREHHETTNEPTGGFSRKVNVSVLEDGSFEWTNSAIHHRIRRDGPQAVHAVDLLLASLGMCVAETVVRFAADHEVVGFESVAVDVIGEEVVAPLRLKNATVDISLKGEMSIDDVVALKHAGERCKIHVTLAQGVIVRIVSDDETTTSTSADHVVA